MILTSGFISDAKINKNSEEAVAKSFAFFRLLFSFRNLYPIKHFSPSLFHIFIHYCRPAIKAQFAYGRLLGSQSNCLITKSLVKLDDLAALWFLK
jgi:hypothetical protein